MPHLGRKTTVALALLTIGATLTAPMVPGAKRKLIDFLESSSRQEIVEETAAGLERFLKDEGDNAGKAFDDLVKGNRLKSGGWTGILDRAPTSEGLAGKRDSRKLARNSLSLFAGLDRFPTSDVASSFT